DATQDSTMDAPDVLELGKPLPNATPGGTCNDGDPDTLAHSIQISCNTSLANWAIEVGGEKLHEQAVGFGFQPEAEAEAQDLEVPLSRSEEHTSELQSRFDLVCRLLLEK